MKKLIFFMIGLVSAIALQAKTIYLNAGDVWNNSSAVFFVHSWSTAEDATDVQMTLLDGNIYKADINDDHNMAIFLRLAPGKTEVVWEDNNDCWGRTDNQTLEEGKDLFTVTAYRAGSKYSDGTWSAYSSDPVVEPEPEVAKYYIAGTMTDWAAKMVEMTAGNGDTLTATIALEADSLYEFKVVRIQGTDTVWYGNVEAATMVYGNSTGWWLKGEVNVGLRTTKAADYLFIFEKNENNMISVVIPDPETIDDPELDLGFYLAGDMTNWADGKVKFEDGTITMSLSEVKTYEMKVIEVTAEGMVWYSADGEMNKDNCTDWILYSDVNANIRLVVETAGEYTFNWNADEKKLSVVYPSSTTGWDEIRMEGVSAKVLVDGVLYIIRDNKMYNVQGMQVR